MIRSCSNADVFAPIKHQEHHPVQHEGQPGTPTTQSALLETRGSSNDSGPACQSDILQQHIIVFQPKIRSEREVASGEGTTHQGSTIHPTRRRQMHCAAAQGQSMPGTPPTSLPPEALFAAIPFVVTVTHPAPSREIGFPYYFAALLQRDIGESQSSRQPPDSLNGIMWQRRVLQLYQE